MKVLNRQNKKRFNFLVLSAFFLSFYVFQNSFASTASLYDYAFNVDGTVTAATPGSVIPSSLGLDPNGFGTMTFVITGAGSHSFKSFFDFEFDEPNNTFFNESGSTGGTLAAGQSWEIDEPGYVFGNIYDHLLSGSLDNTNSVPAGSEDDVSFALGWDFNLAYGEVATITLHTSSVLNTSGFFLQHTDNEVGPNFDISESVYFWSTLSINNPGAAVVPEPSTYLLMLLGLAAIALRLKRK